MSKGITWVVLTDGYYIKIMFYSGDIIRLSTYRDDDFENSSELTYKLITRKRREQALSGEAADEEGLLYKLLGDFLGEKLEAQAYSALLLAAPAEELVKLDSSLPDAVTECIIYRVEGDFLALSQERLEAALSKGISTPD